MKKIIALTVLFASYFSANAFACVGIGDRSVDCIDESGGKACKCLKISNSCTQTITANYSVSGGSRGSVQIPPGKYSENTACTTRRGQAVQYTGFTFTPGQ
jgi:hypothetical protein